MVFSKYIENPKYRIYVIISAGILALIVLVIGAWFVYNRYLSKQEQAATSEFAQIIEDYNMASTDQEINDLKEVITSVANKHKNSKLYPFLIAYKSDLELKQNNDKAAIDLLDIMFEKMDQNNPLYYTYAIKKALLKLDSKIDDLCNKGYNELKDLSNDIKNPLQDMATYYLASYELSKSNKDKAKELFDIIVLKNRQESSWYFMAKDKLESLLT